MNRNGEDRNVSVDPVAVESSVLKTRDDNCSEEAREANSVNSSSRIIASKVDTG